MKKLLFILPVIMAILSACGDGVPNVDDPHNIVVNGEKLKQVDFLQKYCVGSPANETCLKVKNAMSKDFTKGEVPRF